MAVKKNKTPSFLKKGRVYKLDGKYLKCREKKETFGVFDVVDEKGVEILKRVPMGMRSQMIIISKRLDELKLVKSIK